MKGLPEQRSRTKSIVRKYLSIGLAAMSFLLYLTNLTVGVSTGFAAAAVLGISALVFAIAAFVLSLGLRSYVVAGLLAVGGVIFLVPALIATGYLTVIVFPGPIYGVIFGFLVFGLGVAKGIMTARSTKAKPEEV